MTRPSLFGVTFLQVACSFVVIFVTTSSLLGPADRCYLSNKPHELGPCYFAVTAGAVSIGTAVLAGCLSCLSCDCCGLGPVCSILLAAFNCICSSSSSSSSRGRQGPGRMQQQLQDSPQGQQDTCRRRPLQASRLCTWHPASSQG
ncbi:hypothetical protein OEZ85_009752 [Tetradesmus obliquus]|uniref:CASP-like protein n=1 Tax=Tetradesmus obliquus TaxID=3088 RepID=A0ABY8UDV8_TETOB|nr:hypothetical protein OEZ85_009752 [Tetradesmus obliquus]